MRKRSSQRDGEYNQPNILILILIFPFIILKWLGDSIIGIMKCIFIVLSNTYKAIFHLIKQLASIAYGYLPRKLPVKIDIKPTEKIPHGILYRKFHPFGPIKIIPFRIRQYFGSMRIFVKSWLFVHKIPEAFALFLFKTKYFLVGAFTLSLVVAIFQINSLVKSLPNPSLLTVRDIPTSSRIYDRNGKLLYEIYADENRIPVKLSEVPDFVKQATIAIEDREFFNHKGFSPKGIIRAIIHNFNSKTLEGGSTITQQLVRSALLTPEKTYSRKLKEFFLSIWTEYVYTKDQILEMYLNQVPYGGTSWGIEAASETYFGKKVKDLTLAEAALLAGLPAAPTTYSPFGGNTKLAKLRQEEVLIKMVEMGAVNSNEAAEAKEEALSYRKPVIPIQAPHFVMYIKNMLEEQFGPRLVEKGGLQIVTTLDLNIQESAQRIISEQLEKLRPLRVGNGGALVTNPKTGEILAMIGSSDYFNLENDGNVNVTTSLRQPGSSIKVVNYAAALGAGYTAATILDDSPVVFRSTFQIYTPVNYDGKYHGKITLRTALASSYNIPAVKVLSSIGVEKMIEQGKLMGITTWNDKNRFGLSLTLGGGEVTMLDMAKVYGTLANGGKRVDLNPIVKITNYRGESLPSPVVASEIQAITPEIAYIISSILSDNAARTPAFGTNSSLVIAGKTVAVKTGTSDNKRDNWTIGYTPDTVVTVWVGNNDNTPMHPTLTSGVTGAAPIWNEIMTEILKNRKDNPFEIPSNIISMPCLGRTEYFVAGSQPKGGCVAPPTNTPTPSPN